ncbi:SMR family transporter [Caballeronia sp. LZ025]|jgi:multidrug transporter EmrE-like cation transporter|uniref:SMR family transporter n=1 Tax=Caballeronia TaxID=1827195 RepID=UPI001FCFAED3|nr:MULTISPECIES: SMR family transporter [Caballeronia]MDR5732715.1 SMR family transporter [Caballeronia sp. LZ025]
MQYITLLLSGTCSALASILLRLAGTLPSEGGALLFGMQARPLIYRLGAIGAYGAGFVLYALALKRVELSVAYPLMVAVTILEIMLFGVVLGEAMSLRTLAGATLLIASVLLLYAPAASTA